MEKTITALEIQKKNPNRINIFLDGKFAFGISQFVGAWLAVGQVIDEDKINSLLNNDEKERALQSAFRFIGYKQRTEKEIKNKLEQLDFSNEIIDVVLYELSEKKYVNDQEYAQQWIELRNQSKPRSKRYINLELSKKGISAEIISNALENAPDDIDTALNLGKKYLNRLMTIPDDEFRKKITGVLTRRAYSYSVIKDVLSELILLRKENLINEE